MKHLEYQFELICIINSYTSASLLLICTVAIMCSSCIKHKYVTMCCPIHFYSKVMRAPGTDGLPSVKLFSLTDDEEESQIDIGEYLVSERLFR